MPANRRVTVPSLQAMKAATERIVVVTAYDYTMARLVDEAGVDVTLVGDSLAMVVQGRENTVGARLDQMIYHGEMVARATRRALVVVDLPFPTFQLGPEKAIENAARVIQETGCQGVKLEGGRARAAVIAALAGAGIPVMGHIGLLPQEIHKLGGYRMARDEAGLLADAQAVEEAGAFAIVLECVASEIAAAISAAVSIPTIGIGSGPQCDGQVLVLNDLLGLTIGYAPKFVKKYADLQGTIDAAVRRYADEVRQSRFPE